MASNKWKLDPAHSELLFKVKHLMITNVKGEFRSFDATVESDGDSFDGARVELTANTASIFTNNDDRDKHLRSADFFDAEEFPEMTFKSSEMTRLDEGTYRLKGQLTIKGVSNDVVLDAEFGGVMKDPYGNEKAGFSLSGKINRKDWGLNWNAALEAGGVLVSDDVRLAAEVQFTRVG
ncbi:MAG: YceI family protein [Bacteroidetes bacterium]|nr:YceI family protein [Bacteroidota bacterium]